MRTSYDLTRRDVRAFEVFLMRKNLKVMITGTFSFLLGSYWVVAGITQGNQVALGTGLGAFLFIGLSLYVFLVRSSSGYGTWEVDLSDEGVRYIPPNRNEIFIPWANLYGIYQSNAYVYLLINSTAGVVIPKKDLSAEGALFISDISVKHTLQNRKPTVSRTSKRTSRIIILGVIGLLLIVGITNYFSN